MKNILPLASRPSPILSPAPSRAADPPASRRSAHRLSSRPPRSRTHHPAARTFHDARYGSPSSSPPAGTSPARTARSAPSASTPAPPPHRPDARRRQHHLQPIPRLHLQRSALLLQRHPALTAADCAPPGLRPSSHAPSTTVQIAGVPFTHGYDEHGGICTESRDEIYTTSQRRLLPLRPRHQQLLRRRSQRRERHDPPRTRQRPQTPRIHPQHRPVRLKVDQ